MVKVKGSSLIEIIISLIILLLMFGIIMKLVSRMAYQNSTLSLVEVQSLYNMERNRLIMENYPLIDEDYSFKNFIIEKKFISNHICNKFVVCAITIKSIEGRVFLKHNFLIQLE